MKEVLEDEHDVEVRQLDRRLEAQLEIAIARPIFGERFELNEQRWNEVEGGANIRELPQERDHSVVVLEPVQAHPRQDVLLGGEILVKGLVHVPQDGDLGHGVSLKDDSRRLHRSCSRFSTAI